MFYNIYMNKILCIVIKMNLWVVCKINNLTKVFFTFILVLKRFYYLWFLVFINYWENALLTIFIYFICIYILIQKSNKFANSFIALINNFLRLIFKIIFIKPLKKAKLNSKIIAACLIISIITFIYYLLNE